MKKVWKAIWLTALGACATIGLASCNLGGQGGSSTESGSPNSSQSSPVEKDAPLITNKPSGNTLTITDDVNSYQFEVTYDGTVTWISTVQSVASISENGLLTLHSAGYTEIIARDETTGLADSVVLTIVDGRVAETLTIAGIPESFRVGDEAVQLSASSSKGGAVEVTFTSSDPNVATISESGLLTPVSKGVTTITATKVGSNIQASVEVEVLGTAIESIEIANLPKYGMLVGNSYTLSAICTPDSGEDYEIEWSVSNTDVAEFIDGALLAKATGECKITATVKGTDVTVEQTVQVSALSSASEDFRFATAGTANVQNVGPTIAYSNLDGEIIEYGEDQALKITTRGNGADNKLTMEFGDLEEGNYKLSFTYKVLDGRYVGRLFEGDEKTAIAYVSETTYQGEDSYCFYFNQTESGSKKLVLKTQFLSDEGAFLLDDLVVEKVDEVPAGEIGTLVEQDFDDVEFKNGQTANIGGVYVSPNVHQAELVDDANGGKALKVTRLADEQGKGAYGVVAFSLGDLEAGNYKLTLDVENAGYQAIMQVFSFDNKNGCSSMKCIQELNYQTLDQLASKEGNTYTFVFNLTKAHKNFGIALAGSAATTGESITIDNVKFEKMGDEFTIDFESGYCGAYKNSSIGLTHQENSEWVNSPVEAMPYLGITGTLLTEGYGFVTEDGNTYCKVHFKGWDSWATFNLGYLKAGSYLVSMDVELISGQAKGRFGYGIANSLITELNNYEKDGNRYTFKVVLDEDCEDFNIGYKSIAGQNADFVFGFDNITVSKVEDFKATSVEITSTPEDSILKGSTYTFTAKVNPIWADSQALVWSVSDATVGEIDQNGKFTAKGAGTCTITVAVDGTELTASVEIVVKELIPESVTITNAPTEKLLAGDTLTLEASVLPVECEALTLVWTVDNSAVGTIDEDGKFKAVGAGTCVVTVTVEGTEISSSVTINVERSVLPPDEGGEPEGTAPDEYGEWADSLMNSVIN